MKRRWGLLAAVLLAVWLSGCADTTPKEEAQSEPVYQTVYGKIKAINGNEMVLAVMERATAPSREGLPDAEGGEESAAGPTEGRQQGSRPTGEMPEGGATGSVRRGSRPTGSGGDSAQPGQSGQTGQWSQSGQTPQSGQSSGVQGGSLYRLTGDERTYLIPATATVTMGQGDSERTLRFTQLAYKNVVLLSLDEGGAIVKVQVLE